LVEANTTKEGSHKGDNIILQFKDINKADRFPLSGRRNYWNYKFSL